MELNKQLWKTSIFNEIIQNGSKYLLYNSRSDCSLVLNDSQLKVIEGCLHEIDRHGSYHSDEMLEYLNRLGFIVTSSFDEYKKEEEKFLNYKQSKDLLFFSIAPTLACNLGCSYCFQQNIVHKNTMSKEIENGTIELIKRLSSGSKQVAIQWFGGEPLISYDKILRISKAVRKECDLNNIAFYSELITNGTLLTSEIIQTFPEIALNAIQITMDGTPEMYAMRKKISLKKSLEFYNNIIQYTKDIIRLVGNITIRINVDRDNADSGKYVVDFFKKNGLIDNRIDFRLGFINMSRGILDCITHDCFSNTEFGEAETQFRKLLQQEGYWVFGKPEPLKYPCIASLDNAFTIDPSGNIGKCVPAIGTDQSVFSKIYPDRIDQTILEIKKKRGPYADFNPYKSSHCKNCSSLPICLGSCPKMHYPGGEFQCYMKIGFEEKMLFYNDFYSEIQPC